MRISGLRIYTLRKRRSALAGAVKSGRTRAASGSAALGMRIAEALSNAPRRRNKENIAMNPDLETRIRQRAYQLWQNDPSPDDKADQHWEMACRQIEAEGDLAKDGVAPNVDQSADRESGERPAAEQKLQDVSTVAAQPVRAAKRKRA
jgi:hypothetical protein